MSDMLSFSQTVPRGLVHRASVAEVFITSMAQEGDRQFAIGAQIPRFHAFYSDLRILPAGYDLLAFTECCRQACFVIAHTYYRVPHGMAFILRKAEARVRDLSVLAVGNAPAEVVLRCTVPRYWTEGDTVTGAEFEYSVCLDGVEAVRISMSMSWVTESSWEETRATTRASLGLPEVPPTPVVGARAEAERVGRRHRYNTVVGPLEQAEQGAFRSALVVDTTHPVIFDHQLDHIPGMLQLEAWRQASVAAAFDSCALSPDRAVLTGVSATFRRIAELETAAECEVVVRDVRSGSGAGPVVVLDGWMKQDGEIVADARVEVAYPQSAATPPAALETSRVGESRL